MMSEKTIKVITWNEQPNLGDRFTSLWLTHHGYANVETNQWAEGNFVGVGSLLEQAMGHHVTIWGTGRATDSRRTGLVDLSACTVLALRGQLSALGAYGARAAVNLTKGFAMGDPGLLAPDLLEDVPPRIMVPSGTTFVPHWSDRDRVKELYGDRKDIVIVDLLGDPIGALTAIREATYIVSSSLHGLIFADAFGIEREWDWQEKAVGDGFKFRDYASIMGRFQPGDSVKVADSIVSGVQSELREVFDRWAMNAAQ